jgi:3-methyl-2-oxobutanoate hydroxymethyltransferase
MAGKMTAPGIRKLKSSGKKIVCITAYDVFSGAIADESGADLILVGDSVGNVVLGMETTIPVEMDDMLHHTMACRQGVSKALLVADLPFGSYQSSVEQAVDNAVDLAKAGAEAVKLEGTFTDQISAIAKAGIPVMGHVGMTPQSVNAFGGFRVQGRKAQGEQVMAEAKEIQDAGAFGIVLELIPADLAAKITEELDIPTIGIGAGPSCSGQIQVFHDVLGLNADVFKHAKVYVEGRKLLGDGLKTYVSEVKTGTFPTEDNSF